MLGIKTKLVEFTKKNLFTQFPFWKLSNDVVIRNLMQHFRADEYGHQAKKEKADLGYGWIHYGLSRYLKPSRILCIGSRHGYIPAILAQACKDNKKGCVDFVDPGYGQDHKNHWTGTGYWKTKAGKDCFNKFGLGKWIKLYLMTNKRFAKKYYYYYNYIYIDGDHSYKGVKLDYQLFWSRLKKNGFMSFHDISITKPQPEGIYGVHKLWKKISKKNAIVFPFEGSGLGLLQKTA